MSEENLINTIAANPITESSTDPETVLAQLFRKLLVDLKVDATRWAELMDNFIQDPDNRVVGDRAAETALRGNLTMELTRPSMTWKVFAKGLKVLQVSQASFTFTTTHADGQTSTANHDMYL